MIHVTQLTKSYNGRTVLEIDDLHLMKGRSYALLGPNGAGKSTFLRILAGTLCADSGKLIWDEPIGQDDIVYMPQKPYAFSFSVLRNVMIAIKGDMKAEDKRKIALSALDEMGIASLAEAKGNTLSGGEAQRMCLARMVLEPKSLMLLDEPTSATDVASSELIEKNLTNYLTRTGCTLIFSTHQPSQALRISDEAIIFSQGRICESGPTGEVLQNPQSPETLHYLQHWRM